MEYLRWILLVVAVIVVLLVYLRSRARRNLSSQSPLDAANEMPSFSAEDQEDRWIDGVGPVRVVNRDDDVAPVSLSAKNAFDDAQIDAAQSATEAETESRQPEPPIPEPSQSAAAFWNDDDVEISEVRSARPQSQSEPPESAAPRDDEETADTAVQHEAVDSPQAPQPHHQSDAASQPSITEDDVIVLYIVADRNHEMKGEQVLSASIAAQLEFGEMNIFHRLDDNGKIMFSMASVSEPGYFEIEQMHEMKTRGLSLFIQLGLCDDPVHALDEMLLAAHTLATMLNGKMCDASRQLLNETVARGLREKARYYRDKKAQADTSPAH